jgi:flagellar biosynthetic protein FliR
LEIPVTITSAAFPNAFEWFLTLLVSSLRIGAFFIAAPLYGSMSIPGQIKLVTILAVAFLFMPNINIQVLQGLSESQFILFVLNEIVIGLALGLVLTVLFAAAALAAEVIAATCGLGFAAQIDPNTTAQSPVLSQFFSLFLITIFLTLNGHVAVISILKDTYAVVPIGGSDQISETSQLVFGAGEQMYSWALKIALPFVFTIFLINLTIGIVTRSAPQLNLFSFGFPITLISIFVLLYVMADTLGWSFRDLITDSLKLLATLFARG